MSRACHADVTYSLNDECVDMAQFLFRKVKCAQGKEIYPYNPMPVWKMEILFPREPRICRVSHPNIRYVEPSEDIELSSNFADALSKLWRLAF